MGRVTQFESVNASTTTLQATAYICVPFKPCPAVANLNKSLNIFENVWATWTFLVTGLH